MDLVKMNQLKEDALVFGIELDHTQLIQFYKYYELLIEWNDKFNLTAITDFDEVLKKHFLDSIAIGRIINRGEEISILDIGTGAGFPGAAGDRLRAWICGLLFGVYIFVHNGAYRI